MAELRALFDEVGHANRPRIVLVPGYSGVGKTAVVRELHAPVVRERGLFLSGKFDQYRRHVPYSAIVQALSQLVQHLLSESAETLATWKTELAAALGPNGRVLVDVVPDLALLIGPQPPVAELGPGESQNRFQLVFRAFVRLLARPGRPVVLLLDDLQWADRASLDLLQTIWDGANGPLLVVLGLPRQRGGPEPPVHRCRRDDAQGGRRHHRAARRAAGRSTRSTRWSPTRCTRRRRLRGPVAHPHGEDRGQPVLRQRVPANAAPRWPVAPRSDDRRLT